jgi:hypothetical protein
MATYKITKAGSQLCLNIAGDNISVLTENKNVTLWSDSGTNEQKWVVDSLSNGQFIRSAIDTDFGLNIWTANNNCDVHTIAGNEKDAKVDILSSAGIKYTIKLTNYNLYLTAGGSENGANVYWAAPTGGNDQYWTFLETEIAAITPWSWSSANGQWATAALTQNAYNAVAGKGFISEFKWQVWNDICDKVQECAVRAGKTWDYATAMMSARDAAMTAARFNAVWNAVGLQGRVQTGDTVYGSYFVTITDKLNTWINTLNA